MKKFGFVVFLFFVSLVSMVGCGLKDSSEVSREAADNPEMVATTFASREEYSSIQELTSNAEVVVLGSIQKQLETYNLNRLAEENSDAMVVLGTDYYFEVEQYLKGDGEKLIIVTQEGGELNGVVQRLDDRTEMEIGGRYVMFLNQNPDNGKYQFGGNPYKFKVEGQKIIADAGSKRYIGWHKPTLEGFISEVSNNK